MRKAVRGIIIEQDKMLLMHRNKEASQYFTLVGGGVRDGETDEQALAREIFEETGLKVTETQLVFIEEHPAPYNEQYIFICNVAPHGGVAVSANSEEGFMNKLGMNIHTPIWIYTKAFSKIAFRTPQLQTAIVSAIDNGFPDQPVKL
jgi:8-oxo-dGTP pyrophosphatase MutT (NUDIX family)